MGEIWTKYKGRILAVISAAVVALLAIFNEAVTDLVSGADEPAAEEVVVEEAAPAEEAPAEEVVVEEEAPAEETVSE